VKDYQAPCLSCSCNNCYNFLCYFIFLCFQRVSDLTNNLIWIWLRFELWQYWTEWSLRVTVWETGTFLSLTSDSLPDNLTCTSILCYNFLLVELNIPYWIASFILFKIQTNFPLFFFFARNTQRNWKRKSFEAVLNVALANARLPM
jgi:hypothetical protein